MRYWTDEEKEQLIELIPTVDVHEISKKLDRSTSAIWKKAWELGLVKNNPRLTKRTDGDIIIKHSRGIPYKFIRLNGKWHLHHRHIWQESYKQTIPDGMVVSFRDGDTLNCEIENLIIISSSEHIARNRIHKYDIEIQRCIRQKNKLLKTINKRTNGKK